MQIGSNAWVSPSILATILLTGLIQPAGATSAIYLDEEEQARHSTAVVVAQVFERTAMEVETHQRPMQQTRLVIDEVLYGQAPNEVHVVQIGGTRDGMSTALPGDGKLKKGERLLLFLRQDKGQWYLTALSQSVYRLKEASDSTLLEREVDIKLYQKTAEGRLEPIEPVHKQKPNLKNIRRRLKILTRESSQ